MSNIVVTSLMVGRSDTLIPALAISLLLAAAVGFINGSLITLARVTPLVATLGTRLDFVRRRIGLYRWCAHGSISPEFAVCGQGTLWAAGQHDLLDCDRLGHGLDHAPDNLRPQALCGGGTRPAARLMGVPINRTLIATYVLSSVMACLGGLLLTSYIVLV
jgi:ribose transport system permease protein